MLHGVDLAVETALARSPAAGPRGPQSEIGSPLMRAMFCL